MRHGADVTCPRSSRLRQQHHRWQRRNEKPSGRQIITSLSVWSQWSRVLKAHFLVPAIPQSVVDLDEINDATLLL